MRFEMRHGFDCDESTYWEKLFFDDEYNRRLFREGLDFALYEPLELTTEASGDRVRKIRTQPKAELPGPLRKLLGDPVSVEQGRLDVARRRWTFQLIPHAMPDKISIRGEVTFVPTSRGCERVTSVEINVSIFGVGGLLEGFVEKQIRENYDKSAAFTNRYLREKGLAKA